MAMNTDVDGKQHLRELLNHKQQQGTDPAAAAMRTWSGQPPNTHPPAMIHTQQRGGEFGVRGGAGYPQPRGWSPMEGANPPPHPAAIRGQCKSTPLIHNLSTKSSISTV